ncbi:hypothetical protein PR002_g4462 [Phytophthora rubi]|uniref:Uncharacterized protein n=1 Tax=Phytophthora rubi TaxID=129364 RepID=A0A6A3NCT4_9STRA|nr:hypothetical protein PR002_g4462 [Phytophthora rubi]
MQPPSGRSSRARSHRRVSPYPVRGDVAHQDPPEDEETPDTVFAAEQAASGGFAQVLRTAAGAESQADCVGQQRVSSGFSQDLRAPTCPSLLELVMKLGKQRVAVGGAIPVLQAAVGAGRTDEQAVLERVAAGVVAPDLPVAGGAGRNEGQAVTERVVARGTTPVLQAAAGSALMVELIDQASQTRASALNSNCAL